MLRPPKQGRPAVPAADLAQSGAIRTADGHIREALSYGAVLAHIQGPADLPDTQALPCAKTPSWFVYLLPQNGTYHNMICLVHSTIMLRSRRALFTWSVSPKVFLLFGPKVSAPVLALVVARNKTLLLRGEPPSNRRIIRERQ
jgi:hypothetical protein